MTYYGRVRNWGAKPDGKEEGWRFKPMLFKDGKGKYRPEEMNEDEKWLIEKMVEELNEWIYPPTNSSEVTEVEVCEFEKWKYGENDYAGNTDKAKIKVSFSKYCVYMFLIQIEGEGLYDMYFEMKEDANGYDVVVLHEMD